MAKVTKTTEVPKEAPAKSKGTEVTVHGSEASTPVTIRVNGKATTFENGKPQVVSASVLEALKNTAGVSFTVGESK